MSSYGISELLSIVHNKAVYGVCVITFDKAICDQDACYSRRNTNIVHLHNIIILYHARPLFATFKFK